MFRHCVIEYSVAIVDRLIAIDVAIRIRDVVQEHNAVVAVTNAAPHTGESSAASDAGQDIFELDEEIMYSSAQGEHAGSASESYLSASESVRQISGGSAARVSMIDEMAGKLDIMMHVFFSFLQVHMGRKSSENSPSRKSADHLMSHDQWDTTDTRRGAASWPSSSVTNCSSS